MFGDSSQYIFSAVAFLWGKLVTKGTDTSELAFVSRKARFDPIKYLTTTELELQAALVVSSLREEGQCAIAINVER